jgi:hypothetical protein
MQYIPLAAYIGYTKSVASISNHVKMGSVRCSVLFQQQDVFALLVDKLSTAYRQLATRLLSSTNLLQVAPTICQQVVVDNLVAT